MKGDRDQKASQPWSISSGIDPRLEAMTGVLLASASSASAEARLHCLNVCARPSWQTDREYRPLARLTRHGHVAAHHACKLARDGESEAGAAEALRGRGIGLRELLKQLAHLLRRHADAAICHGKLDPAASVDKLSRLQLDLALLGELAGVAQQVEEDLPQPHRIRR